MSLKLQELWVIEAARNSLINELNHTLGDQGLEVDNRYIMLVSDLMCSRGLHATNWQTWNCWY